ncbi:MAG: hypothetical protein QY332_18010 [Anaerolineales bacterium]|nr:MAG: hypothetical protein QY332_18010 [Anaerolineales bacterium]
MYTFGCFFLFGLGSTIGAVRALAKAKQGLWKALIPLPLGTFVYLVLLMDSTSMPYTLTSPEGLPCLATGIGLAIPVAL